jgi:hypothetical protein
MAHNEQMADVDWDGWLDSLLEEKAAREVGDVRAYLIAEISRAMTNSDALRAGDADRLAEIAVDAMIESTRKNRASRQADLASVAGLLSAPKRACLLIRVAAQAPMRAC